MIRMMCGIGVLVAGCGVAQWAFAVDVYRWVDSRGVVQYSDSPPKGQDAAKAQIVGDKLSTVQTVPTTESAQRRADADRIARLERELVEQRNISAAQARADEEAYLRWQEQCARDRRVDCDEMAAMVMPYPATRFGVRSAQFPGGKLSGHHQTVGPGPAGIGAAYANAPEMHRPVLRASPRPVHVAPRGPARGGGWSR